MARLIDRRVQVHAAPDGVPLWFTFRGRRRVVRVLDSWREIGEWWDGKGERTVYRVETDGGGVFELDYRHRDGGWFLYRAYD
ncbi:MAG TPA: DUF6504 family protein [Bacillota bacterium]